LFEGNDQQMNGIFDLEENSEESKHRIKLLKRKYPNTANYLNRLMEMNRPLRPDKKKNMECQV
jgi:hypothetical protein